MKISVSIDLTDDEQNQLAGILQCNKSDLARHLSTHCSAASLEYVRMYLGQRVFTRGSDIREYRLFLLIQTAFGNRIPDEQTVCDLF